MDDDFLKGCAAVVVFLAIVLGFGGCEVYQAHVQAEVYRREGVELTTWEVLMGAKPAERTVNVKDK